MSARRTVFADTSFLIALLTAHDEWHNRALAWERSVRRESARMVTTEAVLWEFLNHFAAPGYRAQAHGAYVRLHRDPAITVVPFVPELIAAAVDRYSARADKGWGVVDCLSFIVMERESITESLTSDHHFDQAGYAALLRIEP
jgi:predicted nucleic acid-binding protein